jgi:hypothetical protein
MIIFLGPDLTSAPRHAGQPTVRALRTLIEAAYSRRPEHAPARANVVALNHLSVRIAKHLGVALPEPWQEFWQAYAGWFAMYSVAPLLANAAIARQALAGSEEHAALIIENWRSPGWWSGRESLEAATRDEFEAAGLTVLVRPGAALRTVRAWLAPWMARRYGEAELRGLARSVAQSAVSNTPHPADVLWLTVGASAVDLVARLQPALAEEGLTSAVLDFDYYSSREALQRDGIPAHGAESFLTEDDLRQGCRWHREAQVMWPEVRQRLSVLPWPDEVTPHQQQAIADRLQLVLRRDAASWRLRSLAAHRALEALAPRVVIGFHVYGPSMAPTIIAARERGIPRLCLQHGASGPRYLALPCLPYDEKLVFGEYARGIMQQACPGLRLTITGHSLYDTRPHAVTPRPEVQALREGANALVVLCTQFNELVYYEPQRWWMRGVAEACHNLGARLAIKLHPSDSPANIKLYQTLVQAGDDSVLIVPHGTLPLNELLAACDLMITRDSTVVLEANLLDKPAMTINLSEADEELPYAATGGALGVYEYEDIGPAIRAVLQDETVRRGLAETRQNFLSQHTGPQDGRAAERIVKIIGDWAETAPRSPGIRDGVVPNP